MLEAITLDGSNISASIDAYVHDYFIDCEGVFKKGNELDYEIVSKNLIKIYDGLTINKGRFLRIYPGTYEEMKIDNSSPDVKRIDLIVIHFETDGVTETLDIRVIKGENDGRKPKIISGDIFNGDLINQVELYAVHVDGIKDFVVEDLREFIPTAADIKNGVGFYCGETDSAVNFGSYNEWLENGKPSILEEKEKK